MPDGWLDYISNRFQLDPVFISGLAEGYVNTSGLVPRPLSPEAFSRLLKMFFMVDSMYAVTYFPLDALPLDDSIQVELRSKIVDALAVGKFIDGTILYTNDDTLLDVEIIDLATAKTRGYPRAASYTSEPDDDIWIVWRIKANSVYNLILNLLIQLINSGNVINGNIILIQPYPPTPPGGGSWPPGTGAPPDNTFEPTPLPGETDLNYNCPDHIILDAVGTNGFDPSGNLTILPIPGLFIPVRKFDNLDVKTLIDNLIHDLPGGPNLSLVREVECCIEWAFLENISVSGFKLTQRVVASKDPVFHITTINANFQPSTSYDVKPAPTEIWQTKKFDFTIPEIGTTFTGVGNVSISKDPNSVIFDNYDEIATIELNASLIPALFDDKNNPFSVSVNSPIFKMGLKRLRIAYATWLGIQLIGDMVNYPCGVLNHPRGFLITDYIANWDFGSGAPNEIMASGNWKSNCDAILIEVYKPVQEYFSLLMPASGMTHQALFDEWRAVNTQAQNSDGVIFLWNQDTAVNQIQYTWLHVPPNQVQFPTYPFPHDFEGWIRIVAYHNPDGHIVVQDASTKCSSITYPPYPAYPFNFNVQNLTGYQGHFEPQSVQGQSNGYKIDSLANLFGNVNFTAPSGTGASLNNTALNGLNTMSLSSSTGYVSSANPPLSGNDKLTIGVVYKYTGNSGDNAVLAEYSSNFNSNNGSMILFRNSSGRIESDIKGTAGYLGTSGPDTHDNQWQFALASYDLTDNTHPAKLYINGVLQTPTSGSGSGNGHFGDFPMYLFKRAQSSLVWQGEVAHIAMFNDLLTSQEITDYSNAMIAKYSLSV